MPELPAHFHPSNADSAGQPWAGRSFEENRFANDDGTTPEAVAAAFAALRDGEHGVEHVVDALRTSRVLIPLVAELGEAGTNEAGLTVDKSADLSIVTVAGPDGRTVLPVFTSSEAMRAWNPAARPVPVDFRTAAVAAVDEGTQLVIVDAGSDNEFGLRRPAVWAVARDEPWGPSYGNTDVARAIAAGIAGEPAVRGIEMSAGGDPRSLVGPELLVVLAVDTTHDTATLRAAVDRAHVQWSADPVIVAAVDSMAVRITGVDPDGAAPDAPPTDTVDEPRGLRRLLRRRGSEGRRGT